MTSPSTNTVFIQCRTTQTQSGFYSQGCRQTDTQSIMELWGWGLTATHTENESQRLRHSWEHTNIGLKATWRQRFKKNTFRQYWRNNCNEKRKHSKFKKNFFSEEDFFFFICLRVRLLGTGKVYGFLGKFYMWVGLSMVSLILLAICTQRQTDKSQGIMFGLGSHFNHMNVKNPAPGRN